MPPGGGGGSDGGSRGKGRKRRDIKPSRLYMWVVCFFVLFLFFLA